MSCRTNHLPHSSMVTGEDTLLSWWNVASRGPRAVRVCSPCRAHLFALDVILSTPISLFAFVAESAKARPRRHGPERHRCLIACRLCSCLAYCLWRLAGLHFLILGLSVETIVYFLWFLLAPVRREEVSLPLSHPARGIRLRYDLGSFSRIFINGAHGVSGVFKVSRRQWRVANGQWARRSTANMVVRFRAFS